MYRQIVIFVVAYCIAGSLAEDEFDTHSRAQHTAKPPCNFKRSQMIEHPVKYHLLTGLYDSRQMETQIRSDSHPLHFKYLDKKKPTVMVIPGRYNQKYFYDIADKFWEGFTNFDYNTILVQYILTKYYSTPANKTKELLDRGEDVSKGITDLHRKNITMERIVAHRQGVIVGGKAVNSLTGFKVQRFVALDPPKDMLEVPAIERLSKKSVNLLEVVHTSIGKKSVASAIGHRDFYPNGGTDPQLNCKTETDLGPDCSNILSYIYYTSLRWDTNKMHKAHLCSSWSTFVKGKCFKNPSVFLLNSLSSKDIPNGKYYLNTPSLSDILD